MRPPKILHVRFAIQGLWTALKEETQVLWGLICACLMFGISLWHKATLIEIVILLTLFGAVLSLEMFNGALERLCNKVEPKYDPAIKKIKDLASGAVLLLSLVTLTVWILITFF